MAPRCLALAGLICCQLFGQAMPLGRKVEEYPAHATFREGAIGAEYTVRTFSGRGRTFAVSDYLVVEVALVPLGKPLIVSGTQFTLRLNGKKQVLFAQPPSFVAASLKYSDWEMRPGLEAHAGAGDAGVILGRPTVQERFPGDPRPGQTRLPSPPRSPAPDMGRPESAEPPPKAEEVVIETALPEGETRGAATGFLYFAHKGKTKSIKSVELLYNGPGGVVTLRLM